nr:MAG TPA_asm: hypothetical protein [Caudoviricetes sp.]
MTAILLPRYVSGMVWLNRWRAKTCGLSRSYWATTSAKARITTVIAFWR